MSEKKPRKGKGQFKVKTPKTNPPQNNEDKIRQLAIEADRYLEEQNYEEAIKCYTKIIEIDPNHKYAHNDRGVYYYRLDRYKEAINNYNKVIELDPIDPYVYYNRGLSYYKLEKYDEAIIDYNKAIALDPTAPCNYGDRGLSYHNLGRYDEAISDFNKAIELDINTNTSPTYREVYFNRANLYNDLKDHKKAINDFNEAIDIDKKYKEAYNNRAGTYFNLGEFDKAINDYTDAINLDPTYTDFYNHRADNYFNLGEFDKAINDYTKVIELDSTYINTYFNRGLAYVNLKKYDDAIEDYNKVIETDPDFKDVYLNRALVYGILKKYDEALKDLTEGATYQVFFLLIGLYTEKKIDIDQVIDTIKAIINKQKNDSFESEKTNRDETTNEIIDIIKNKNGEQIDINPHTLYSYVPFDKNTIDTIVQGYKYANEIFDFNDPTDPTIKLIPETKEIIEILKNIRIACFSTSPLSTLMYSHYTDKHKGICIEYDFSDFDTENTSLLEVKYKEELKIDSKIFQIMMKSDNDINEEISFLDLFRTKHLNWEYEKEYRVITYDVDKIYRPIKAIYLGKDISDSDIKLIKTLIESRPIKLYQVALHEHNVFRLEAKEINIE